MHCLTARLRTSTARLTPRHHTVGAGVNPALTFGCRLSIYITRSSSADASMRRPTMGGSLGMFGNSAVTAEGLLTGGLSN